MGIWSESLEQQLLCEGRGWHGAALSVCLLMFKSGEAVHLGRLLTPALEPSLSPNLLLKMETKLFGGQYSNSHQAPQPTRDVSWWFPCGRGDMQITIALLFVM